MMNFSELIELLEAAGYEPRSYSGRGMAGQECVAVRAGSELSVMCDLIEALPEKALEISALFRNCQIDTLGRGYIIYWKNVEWEGSEEGESE